MNAFGPNAKWHLGKGVIVAVDAVVAEVASIDLWDAQVGADLLSLDF